MSDPLVSVIIPAFNRARFLRDRALASVLRQTYANWEVIVVGDGPRNGRLHELVESYGDRRMRYTEIPRPEYGAMSPDELWHAAGAAARNHGLALAQGEVIAPLDDDDEFFPDHLAQSVAAIARGGADFVYGNVTVRNFETGREYADYFPWSPENRELFLRRNIMFHSSVAYSRRYRELRYPVDGSVPADYGLWLRIHEAGASFTSLADPQAVYYGDNVSGTIRVSAPSLPPFEAVQPLLARIYESGQLSNNGPALQALTRELSHFLGGRHVVCAPSGDVALILAFHALRASGAAAGGEVVMPSYAFPSLPNAVLWNGFVPVFCDVDPATLCITPATAAACIGPRTVALAPLHPHGFPAAMGALEALARERGIALVSDAASALGAEVNGRRVGTFGDVEVFSMSPTKPLSAGEGGFVSFADPQLAAVAARAGRYGLSGAGIVDTPGINAKLGEIPAALALAGLPYLPEWLEHRRALDARYRAGLAGLPMRFVEPADPSAVSTCKDMVLILPTPAIARDLALHLADYRITTRPYYATVHAMPAYRGYARGDLSGTEQIAGCTLCVPLYGGLRHEVVDLVVEVIREFYQ